MYRPDLRDDVAVEKQNYTLFLGGMQPTHLRAYVTPKETMAELGKRMGVTFVGYLIEYRLSEVEDLKIVSLLLKPSAEKRYICRCMKDKSKLPLHIHRGATFRALGRLSETCHCNLNFTDYMK